MSDETKRLDVDAIEARADAATVGEWVSEADNSDPQDPCSMVVLRASPGICVAPFLTLRDSLFIAAARTDVPDLVAEVRRLREIVEGRSVPPTDAEIYAHRQVGAGWMVSTQRELGVASPQFIDHSEARDGGAPHGSLWWPLDADGRPCAWPVAP